MAHSVVNKYTINKLMVSMVRQSNNPPILINQWINQISLSP